MIEPMLYIDNQAITANICPECGGAVYQPGFSCLRCERNGYDPAGNQ